MSKPGRKRWSWVWEYFQDNGRQVKCLVANCRAPVIAGFDGNTVHLHHHLRYQHQITKAGEAKQKKKRERPIEDENMEEELRELKRLLLDQGWLSLSGVDRPAFLRVMHNYAHFCSSVGRNGYATPIDSTGRDCSSLREATGAHSFSASASTRQIRPSDQSRRV
jgi:hypothetical protein